MSLLLHLESGPRKKEKGTRSLLNRYMHADRDTIEQTIFQRGGGAISLALIARDHHAHEVDADMARRQLEKGKLFRCPAALQHTEPVGEATGDTGVGHQGRIVRRMQSRKAAKHKEAAMGRARLWGGSVG